MGKHKRKEVTKKFRIEKIEIDSPAKFDFKEEQKTHLSRSAVEISEPIILKNATKKKWSTQFAKVSVKNLGMDD